MKFQLFNSDLNSMGTCSLPEGLLTKENGSLEGNYFLQVLLIELIIILFCLR